MQTALSLVLAYLALASATTSPLNDPSPDAVAIKFPPLLDPALAQQDRNSLDLLEPRSQLTSHWYHEELDAAVVATHNFTKPAVKLEDSTLINRISCSDIDADGLLKAYVSFNTDEALNKALSWPTDTPIVISGGAGCHEDRKAHRLISISRQSKAARTVIMSLERKDFHKLANNGHVRLASRRHFPDGTITPPLSKRESHFEQQGPLRFNKTTTDLTLFDNSDIRAGIYGWANGNIDIDFEADLFFLDPQRGSGATFRAKASINDPFSISSGIFIQAAIQKTVTAAPNLFVLPVIAIGAEGVAEVGLTVNLQAFIKAEVSPLKFQAGPVLTWKDCDVQVRGVLSTYQNYVNGEATRGTWKPEVSYFYSFDLPNKATLSMGPQAGLALGLSAAGNEFNYAYAITAAATGSITGEMNGADCPAGEIEFKEGISADVALSGPFIGNIPIVQLPTWNVAHQCIAMSSPQPSTSSISDAPVSTPAATTTSSEVVSTTPSVTSTSSEVTTMPVSVPLTTDVATSISSV